MRFLLDTCTFLWLAMPQNKLSPLACELLDEADHEWFLSDVSQWEVVMKYSSGKLPLPGEAREWLPSQLEFHRLERCPMTTAGLSGAAARSLPSQASCSAPNSPSTLFT